MGRTIGDAGELYGLTVTGEMVEAAREGLTDPSIEGLVAAHLRINYGYFGGIDKTLSGFFVLDSQGDDYTLLDARDGGQVFWQDHETREIALRFDSLADWLAWKAEVKKGGEDADADEIRKGYRPAKESGTRRPTTPALAARYQWLVWLLAQPLRQDGKPIQTADELVRAGMGRFFSTWPETAAAGGALDAEFASLAEDPHLGIYWLLHTTMVADDEGRSRVLTALGGKKQPPLVDAFVEAFGRLPLTGDVAEVPDFRVRRADAVSYAAARGGEAERARASLRSLEIAPSHISLARASWVGPALEKDLVADAEVAAVLSRIAEASPGVLALRALLDKRSGKTENVHADALARAIGAGVDEPWGNAFVALLPVHTLVKDLDAAAAAVGWLMKNDGLHARILAMAIDVQTRAGRDVFGPLAELERKRSLAQATVPLLERLKAEPDRAAAIIAEVTDPALRVAVARRVAQRATIDKPAAAVARWALRELVASGEPDREALIVGTIASLDFVAQPAVLGELAKDVDSVDHPLVSVMVRVLTDPKEADGADFMATMARGKMMEGAIAALAPFAHEPAIFEAVMGVVERPAGRAAVEAVWSKLMNPFEPKTYMLHKLDAAQATRIARSMVTCRLSHPDIHARNGAGHQLYRFDHPGAEPFLLDALVEYGEKFAASSPGEGKKLDRDTSEDDVLEDLMANLYSAVRNMKTPRSRAALIERLFTERREYWRMGNALGEVFSPEVHAEALSRLEATHDGHAAGCYAYAIHDFQKTAPPLVDLIERIVAWPAPTEVVPRRFFKYALRVGIEAALSKKSYELVRRAHALAETIAEAPLDPDDHARGKGWKDPLETDAKLRDSLQAVLEGKADARLEELREAAALARAKKKPKKKISDADLAALAGADVASRLLHDPETGEVWFVDPDGAVGFFDGYDVGAAPFTARRVGFEPVKELLAGVTSLSERAMFWTSSGASFVEVIRFDDRLVYRRGPNNGQSESFVFRFPTEADAAGAVVRLRAFASRSAEESSPYYLEGKGAILRSYYLPGTRTDRRNLFVHDGSIERGGERFATDEDAIRAHEARELEWLRDTGARLGNVEWMERMRARRDVSLVEWMKGRIRNDARDAVWHVRALTEIDEHLRTHGLLPLVPAYDVALGPPAGEADLASLASARGQPIPESLALLWKATGSARWTIGDTGMRLLSPAEVLARRPVARAYGAKASPPVADLDVIVEASDGTPATFWVDAPRNEGRVFAHATAKSSDLWWEKSLSWMLATGLLSAFVEQLSEGAPVLMQLLGDQAFRAETVRQRFVKRDAKTGSEKFWEVIADDATPMLSTRYGKVGTPGTTSMKRLADGAAVKKELAKVVAAKKKEGYAALDA